MSVYENNYDSQLKQLIRNNTRFVSLMGHEIRTYMNAIIGFATILENEPITQEQKEFVNSILDNGNGLIGLTDKIVEYSRIRAMDKAGVLRSAVDSNSIIKLIENKWSGPIRQKGIEFNIKQSSSLPEQFNSCQDHIVRCIDILIENSLNYTESGYINVILSSKEESENGVFLMIDVEDSGAGIATELQHTVFEPFERGDHDEMTAGMGLAILACVVELHNGAVYFDSSPGEGSDFSICMPIESISNKDAKARLEDTTYGQNIHIHHPEQDSGISAKILIADDNYSSRKLMKFLLENMGCECIFAKNGKSVLKMVTPDIDIVLMDIRMPDMSGLEVTSILREKGFTKPIIAVTAFAMPYDQEECLNAGCNGYISKPLSREILFKTLKEQLAK